MVIAFIVAMVSWPIWAMIVKAVCGLMASAAFAVAEPEMIAKYTAVVAEAGFFYCIINAWVWQVLIMGNYQKTLFKGDKLRKGLLSILTGCALGLIVLLVLVLFLGNWWEMFNIKTLLMPQTAEQLQLAIEGWEVINFFTLTVLIVQIPYVSLFHKWPYAGKVPAPYDGIAALMTSFALALLVWFGTVLPSLVEVDVAHTIIGKPFGDWPSYLAFAQAFIWWFLIPAEGGENYPMKLVAKKQPYMGIVGLVIALIGGLVTPHLIKPFLMALNLPETWNINSVAAAFMVSIITFMLIWHHLFDDYPSKELVPNSAIRVLTRIIIWIVGGIIWGVLWLKVLFFVMPNGAFNFGLGYPSPGLLAGQFCVLMAAAMLNTYFDKWPVKR
ncbi:hypothetical protein Q5O14_14045 [Eubacteriaceae bacterium ES2]|nr:hypothetical protein Q5O14_14045 [Eubacteriaceae bacterium ES2]